MGYLNTKLSKPQPLPKPVCRLPREGRNVFNIIGRVSQTLRQAGLVEESREFTEKALSAESYDQVIQLAKEYVNEYWI